MIDVIIFHFKRNSLTFGYLEISHKTIQNYNRFCLYLFIRILKLYLGKFFRSFHSTLDVKCDHATKRFHLFLRYFVSWMTW